MNCSSLDHNNLGRKGGTAFAEAFKAIVKVVNIR
jgi:hypothetical protein